MKSGPLHSTEKTSSGARENSKLILSFQNQNLRDKKTEEENEEVQVLPNLVEDKIPIKIESRNRRQMYPTKHFPIFESNLTEFESNINRYLNRI